jgi:hypothetical protein
MPSNNEVNNTLSAEQSASKGKESGEGITSPTTTTSAGNASRREDIETAEQRRANFYNALSEETSSSGTHRGPAVSAQVHRAEPEREARKNDLWQSCKDGPKSTLHDIVE